MGMTFYKYNGAGNDFLVADNREGDIHLSGKYISEICDRHYGVGADGVMLLGAGRDGVDFTMEYFNSDGSGGMMCGNGGRCIAAFADFLGIRPSSSDGLLSFIAADGRHEAAILERKDSGMTVRLKMSDISVAVHHGSLAADSSASGWFIDTGTRHFVRFISGPVDGASVAGQGKLLRWSPEFAPQGANINFVLAGNPLKVRTFEKGVEAETCACGTGITASAAAAWLEGVEPAFRESPAGSGACPADLPAGFRSGSVHYDVDALNDRLAVDFIPLCPSGSALCQESEHGTSAVLCPATPSGASTLFTDVHLTGPTMLVAEVRTLHRTGDRLIF